MDREAWQATVHGIAKELDVTKLQNNFTKQLGAAQGSEDRHV